MRKAVTVVYGDEGENPRRGALVIVREVVSNTDLKISVYLRFICEVRTNFDRRHWLLSYHR